MSEKAKNIHIIVLFIGCLVCGSALWAADGGEAIMAKDETRIHAPDFVAGLDWVNTPKPISLRDLQGKTVLLDFWTYSCINCLHTIPDIKKLEAKYGASLVVIGVHSGKHPREKETEAIRMAAKRLEIKHPVVNDKDMDIWQRYTVKAWPSFVLIDGSGRIAGSHVGEGVYDALNSQIGKVISETGGKTAQADIKQIASQSDKSSSCILSFPGKVLADAASDSLFIADSNHNRIVVAGINDGIIREIIGNGSEGRTDGDFGLSSFNHPQGIVFDGDYLYVADTENHLIRRVDMKARKVETIAGTGKQASFGAKGGLATSAALNSPWDLALVDKALYIAMAGSHQIWVMNLESKRIEPYAGSGQEGLEDGSLSEAQLAQPSGLAIGEKKLYVADSEASAIRAVDLPPAQRVETLVGKGLFDFGDVDGPPDSARLQHPMGVAFYNDRLFVADALNNKIKWISLDQNQVRTLAGLGKPGLKDGKKSQFNEPGGLSLAGDRIFIADTNNHAIRVIDLKTHLVTTLELKEMGKRME